MKVVARDNLIVLYLNNALYENIDLKDKENLNKSIKKLLLKLHDNYNLDFKGYYDITLYVDRNYGVIIEIKKEELEYLDYFGNSIEINTKILEDSFLYEMNDIIFNDNYLLYTLNGNIYIKINKPVNSVFMGTLLEKTNKIIYGKERKRIIKKAKIWRWWYEKTSSCLSWKTKCR